eukprot:1155672-Pelagomonas_calceolata.AAC.4
MASWSALCVQKSRTSDKDFVDMGWVHTHICLDAVACPTCLHGETVDNGAFGAADFVQISYIDPGRNDAETTVAEPACDILVLPTAYKCQGKHWRSFILSALCRPSPRQPHAKTGAYLVNEEQLVILEALYSWSMSLLMALLLYMLHNLLARIKGQASSTLRVSSKAS